MKKLLLMKSLLVAVLLGVGQSAWGISADTFGATDYSTAFNTLYSDAVSIPADNTVTISFVNHTAGTANHQNWAVAISNDKAHGGDGYTEYLYLRADRYGWTPSANTTDTSWYLWLKANYVWGDGDATFRANMQNAHVTLTIKRMGTFLNVRADMTTESGNQYYQDFAMNCTDAGTIRAYMTVEGAYLTNLTSTAPVASNIITNANIDFTNAITEGQVAGSTGAPMAISDGSGTYKTAIITDTDASTDDSHVLALGDNCNHVVTIPTAERPKSKDIMIFNFAMGFGDGDGTYGAFYIKDENGANIAYLRYGHWNGGSETNLGVTLSTANFYKNGTAPKGPIWNKRTKFTVILNYATQQITTITQMNGSTAQAPIVVDMTNSNPVATFSLAGKAVGDVARRTKFGDLEIKSLQGDYSSSKTITYAYKDNNDNDITDLILGFGGKASDDADVNSTYSPIYQDVYTDAEYAYDYTYTSGGDAFTVTDDATITLVYTKSAHATTDVTVQYKYGDDVIKEEVVAENYPVGKSLSFWVNEFVLKDGVFYRTTQGANFYQRQAVASATITENLSLTGIDDVVFFTEAEDLEGASTSSSINGPIRLSHGAGAYFGSNTTVTTLTPGKYKVWLQIRTSSQNTLTIKAGETTVHSLTVKGNNTNGLSDEFTIYENTNIIIPASGADNAGYDCLYIIRTGDASVSKTITAGWATYCSPYALDFSSPIDNLEAAYIVTGGNGTTLTTTPITSTIPANTGILLKGSGECVIPVVASSTTDVSANKLVGVTAETPDVAAGIYVLLNGSDNTSGPVGFYKTDNAFTVGANTAYLSAGFDGTSARAFYSLFDSETTSVGAALVNNGTVKNEIFNMQGQRVGQPTKGLYIVNGKKIIVK